MSVPVTHDPNRLGVLGGDLQGFPNGRRLTDDVVDIELQALEGAFYQGLPPHVVAALAAGDKVDHNDRPFSDSFPYVALPNDHSGNTAGSGDQDNYRGPNDNPFTPPNGGDHPRATDPSLTATSSRPAPSTGCCQRGAVSCR